MKAMTHTSLTGLLLAALSACGTQVVEFPIDDTDIVDTDTDVADPDTDDTDADDPDTDDTDADDTDDTDADDTDDTDADDTDDTDADDTDTVIIDTDIIDTDIIDTDIIDTDVEVAPTVVVTFPEDGDIDVELDVIVSATFDMPMDLATFTAISFVVTDGLTPVIGLITLDDLTDTVSFAPSLPLAPGQQYQVVLTTQVFALGGLALDSDYSWTFTTAFLPPEVVSSTPEDLATGVSVNTRLSATFDMPMDPGTLDEATFTVFEGLNQLQGSVSYDSDEDTVTFTPDEPLEPGLTYTATITTEAESLDGVGLAQDFEWTFMTDACSLARVDLGDAADFAVLAGSSTSNTGNTEITGDVGVSPGSSISGYGTAIVTGTFHAGDVIAAEAMAALTTAFDDAAGRVLCPITVAGNIGGTTLTPGLYKSTSSLAVSSGELTLDAQGDPDAVFIFQMASTLTTTPGRQVILTNGANANNIFWQVGSSATLDTTSVFHGTILAQIAISMNTGATLNGRALTRIDAVTLQANTIVVPTP